MTETVFMTSSEVCGLLRISDETLRQWVRDGKLDAVSLGPRTLRVYRKSVEALIEKGRINAPSAANR